MCFADGVFLGGVVMMRRLGFCLCLVPLMGEVACSRARKGSAMDEASFWELVDRSVELCEPGSDGQYKWLSEQLKVLPVEEIIQFENRLNELKAKCCTFPVLAANFIMQSYVSDDVFEDFRLWLISNGKARFYAALGNPDSIADFCDVEDPVVEINGEGLLYVAGRAYREKTGNDDFVDRAESVPDPDIDEEWPDKKEGFEELMPKLYRKFWNQERVDEMHG